MVQRHTERCKKRYRGIKNYRVLEGENRKVPVEDNPGGLEVGGPVELEEEFTHHGTEVLDHFLSVLLDPHGGGIP